MSPAGETEVVLEKPKRVPRKRAPKAVLSDDAVTAPVKRAAPKRAPRKVAPKVEVEEVSEERVSNRKAPTPIAAERAKTKRGRKNITVVAILLLLGVGSSAAVGFTDKGQINVDQTIAQRNQEARAAGQPEITIPVQTSEPNGGLVGLGDDPALQQQASSTPSTASSTEATASSTEEAASTETASTSDTTTQ